MILKRTCGASAPIEERSDELSIRRVVHSVGLGALQDLVDPLSHPRVVGTGPVDAPADSATTEGIVFS